MTKSNLARTLREPAELVAEQLVSAEALPAGCMRLRRRWDELTWPRATRGYFQVKTAIPAILGRDSG